MFLAEGQHRSFGREVPTFPVTRPERRKVSAEMLNFDVSALLHVGEMFSAVVVPCRILLRC